MFYRSFGNSRVRDDVGQTVPWRLATVALSIALVAFAVAVWWFWPRGGDQQGGGAAVENVRLDYQMWFYYYGSEENVSLENLRLDWSAPKVDNEYIGQTFNLGLTWELYYIEDDSTLTLEANMAGYQNFRGARSSQPQMYEFGWADSEYGPAFSAWFDKLYPREVFLDVGYFTADKETADKATLKVYGQTDSKADWWAFGQENQRINFSFWVGLWRENVLVEQFEWVQENGAHASYWLWPVT